MRGMRRRMMFNDINLNVEYIVADGRQEMKSDWIPLLDTKVRAVFTQKGSFDKLCIFAIRTSGEDEAAFSILTGGTGAKNYLEFYNNYIWPKNDTFLKLGVFADGDFEVVMDSNGAVVNGVRYTNKRTTTCKKSTRFFYANNNGYSLIVKRIQCWNNGILERDFVPAKRNGIYGLYDKVNKRFWRSDTGVDFLGKDK